METKSLENIFARSWQLLTRNWILVVPGLVVGLIVGVADALLAPPQPYADTSTTGGAIASSLSSTVGGAIVGILAIAGFVITTCYTVGMSGAAWERGTTTLSDGAASLREDAGHVFVAAIGLFLIGVVAVLLAFPTLFLSVVVYYLFMLYVLPSAVVGNHRGFAAIGESVRLTRTSFVPTMIIGIVLAVLQFFFTAIAHVFSFAPLLGPIVAAVLAEAVVAYGALVVVGEYLNLRGTPVPPAL